MPCITKENLTCIGVEEASVGWNDDPMPMKDNQIEFCSTGIILSNNYDCIAPIGMENYMTLTNIACDNTLFVCIVDDFQKETK